MAHDQPAATHYVNWVGRTVRQIREESALRQALETYVDTNARALGPRAPAQVFDDLRAFVARERQAGRLTLTAPEPTPLGWRLRKLLHLIGVPVVLLLASPLLLLYLPVFAIVLRRRERSDPEIAPRPDAEHVRRLAELEDHDVTNQFSAMGTLKPGWFRRTTLIFVLWIVAYTTRHIYTHGFLARVGTIHFARWTFLDDKRAAPVRQQLRRQPGKLHGRLHQQGRVRPERRVHQRRGLPAHAVARAAAAPRTSRSSSTSSAGTSCRRRSGTTRIPVSRQSSWSGTATSAPAWSSRR